MCTVQIRSIRSAESVALEQFLAGLVFWNGMRVHERERLQNTGRTKAQQVRIRYNSAHKNWANLSLYSFSAQKKKIENRRSQSEEITDKKNCGVS